MLTLYCDYSFDRRTNICTWGCVIFYKKKQYTYCDYKVISAGETFGELWAIVKGLGKVKAFPQKKILICTDYQEIVNVFQKLSKVKPRNYKKTIQKFSCSPIAKTMYYTLTTYMQSTNLTITKIPRTENPAHHLARKALYQARAELGQQTESATP